MFLTDIDYGTQIKQVFLDQVTESDPALVRKAEYAAIEEVGSYLSGRYDLQNVFIDVLPWDNATAWIAGQQVTHQGGYWVALQDNSGKEPGQVGSENYWENKDLRNPKVVQVCVDVVLYDLHSRIAKRQIPELRVVRYDDGIAWLKQVYKKNVNPNLPPNEDPEKKDFIRGGSNPRRSNAYY